jgi:hypothetical protein
MVNITFLAGVPTTFVIFDVTSMLNIGETRALRVNSSS